MDSAFGPRKFVLYLYFDVLHHFSNKKQAKA